MEKLTEKQVIEMIEKKENPKSLAINFSDYVNVMGYSEEKDFIAELLRTDTGVQELFSELSFAYIKKLCYLKKNNWFDARNKYSVEIACKIKDAIGEEALNHFVPDYNGEMDEHNFRTETGNGVYFASLFAEQMGMKHRTLQETFSGIVFKWIAQLENASNIYLQELGLVIYNSVEDMKYL